MISKLYSILGRFVSKKIQLSYKKQSLTLAALLSLTSIGHAVLPFNVTTTSNGTINNGSWEGDGTVRSNLNPGTYSRNGLKKDVFIEDFSTGSFTINEGALNPRSRVTAETAVTISLEIIGGSADLILANSTPYDDGDSMYNSVGLTNFRGEVTEIIWTVAYTLPIAARSDSVDTSNGYNVVNRPLGAGLGLVSAGTGVSRTDFDVTLDYGGVYTASTANGTFTEGLPNGAVALASHGWDSVQPGSTSFVSSNGFTGLVTLGESSPHFLMVRGYDYAGQDGFNKDNDSPLVYINYLTYRVTLEPGMTFASNTEFTMSLDGQQFSNLSNVPTAPVPEPAGVIMAGVALMYTLLLRRRSC